MSAILDVILLDDIDARVPTLAPDFTDAKMFYGHLSDELDRWGRHRLAARDMKYAARSRRRFLHAKLDEVLDEVEQARGVWP